MARRMRTCPVCGAENEDLAVVCVHCKGYVQAKVDTIDLFHTMWGLLENPRATFRRIAIAGSKNYVLMLALLFGVAFVFVYLWHTRAGVVFPSLVTILAIGLVAGPPTGLLLTSALAVLVSQGARLAGGGVTIRNAFAILAYACFPIVVSLVLVFPLEIAVFGIYLFDSNPSPWVLNPAAFAILAGLDGAAVLWSYVLFAVGLHTVASVGRLTGFLLAALLPALLAGLLLVRIW